MENYDCNQSAERVLMDASRKKNQNRNRLLFIVIIRGKRLADFGGCFRIGKIQDDIFFVFNRFVFVHNFLISVQQTHRNDRLYSLSD